MPPLRLSASLASGRQGTQTGKASRCCPTTANLGYEIQWFRLSANYTA